MGQTEGVSRRTEGAGCSLVAGVAAGSGRDRWRLYRYRQAVGVATRDVAAVDAVRHGDTLTRRLGWYPLVRLNNGRTIWIDAIGFGSPAEPSPENLAMLAQIREPLNVSGEIIPLRSRHRRRTGAV